MKWTEDQFSPDKHLFIQINSCTVILVQRDLISIDGLEHHGLNGHGEQLNFKSLMFFFWSCSEQNILCGIAKHIVSVVNLPMCEVNMLFITIFIFFNLSCLTCNCNIGFSFVTFSTDNT